MVRLKRFRLENKTCLKESLNSTMVRLKLFVKLKDNETLKGSLNSTMVRLKLKRIKTYWVLLVSLNSTMVRLKQS